MVVLIKKMYPGREFNFCHHTPTSSISGHFIYIPHNPQELELYELVYTNSYIGSAGCTLKVGAAGCTLKVGAAGCTLTVGAAGDKTLYELVLYNSYKNCMNWYKNHTVYEFVLYNLYHNCMNSFV